MEIGHGSVLVEPTLCALGESSSLLEVPPAPTGLAGGCGGVLLDHQRECRRWVGLTGLTSVPPGGTPVCRVERARVVTKQEDGP